MSLVASVVTFVQPQSKFFSQGSDARFAASAAVIRVLALLCSPFPPSLFRYLVYYLQFVPGPSDRLISYLLATESHLCF